jgi:hypothetical protein
MKSPLKFSLSAEPTFYFNTAYVFFQFTLLYSSLLAFLAIKLPSVYYMLCDKTNGKKTEMYLTSKMVSPTHSGAVTLK